MHTPFTYSDRGFVAKASLTQRRGLVDVLVVPEWLMVSPPRLVMEPMPRQLAALSEALQRAPIIVAQAGALLAVVTSQSSSLAPRRSGAGVGAAVGAGHGADAAAGDAASTDERAPDSGRIERLTIPRLGGSGRQFFLMSVRNPAHEAAGIELLIERDQVRRWCRAPGLPLARYWPEQVADGR